LGQPTNTPNGSLVVYATKAGDVAEDNSYFIDALISNIKTPNQSVRDLGDNISLSVAQKSSYHQVPVIYSMLLPKIILKSGGGVQAVESKPISTPKPITTSSKWMKDTGEKAEWKKAKVICRAKGGRLPTIEELRKVIMDCGGVINDGKNNNKNSSYQSCYKAKGFASNNYWSSTTNASVSSDAWYVSFYFSSNGWYDK